jgi:hypothetical protein
MMCDVPSASVGSSPEMLVRTVVSFRGIRGDEVQRALHGG